MASFVDSVVPAETMVVPMKAGPVGDFTTFNQRYQFDEPGAGNQLAAKIYPRIEGCSGSS